MTWEQLTGMWKQLAGRAQAKWGKLSGDDLRVVEGDRERLIGKIQERYGVAKDEAERQVDEWISEL